MTLRILLILTLLSIGACSKPEDTVLCAAESLKRAKWISVGPFGETMNKGYAAAFIRKVDGSHEKAAREAEKLADKSHPYEPLIANATCEALLTENDRQWVTNFLVEDGLAKSRKN